MITANKTTPPTVTPQIRPAKQTNDYSNQDHTTYCYITNKTYSLVLCVGVICGLTVGCMVLIAVIISILLCLICGVTVGCVVLIAVIISIFCRSYDDYSNQDHTTHCNTTNKTSTKY
jgi:uncharacterized membrane protein